ncbi:uncharacterized protein LOC106875615 [Octopus bimaculoides]|uniref:Torsin-1A-interacting protein 1/2 AAA+ activator domain-containing protein n=1 Tax=Octopus bimaculoides TaxID=37653 RepID=A0A0L8GQ38_OCTBM|nr:uncharacterized protein LOC106875615 [Octopus bimaculoides]XP_014779317.1 uncharacterized protein LOC106875615 [Octopus bimaculoides]|eukprot:XP_014779316.1 PREDICTED: uncharacterized protein LOC106875615 [Octopus bimaculoides]
MTICNRSRQDVKDKPDIMKRIEQCEGSSKWTVVLSICVFLICCFVPSKSFQAVNISNISEPPVNPFKKLVQNIKTLKNMFKTQSDRTWNILKSSTHHIITSEEPDRPAVIMMVLPNSKSEPMALCLAQHFSHDITKILNCHTATAASYPAINGAEYVNYEIGDQKIKLDNSIQNLIKYHRSIIINHLEKFHSETVMYFHGLCDTTEAMYKQIAVIFLLETPYEIKNEVELSLYLENLWSDIDHIRIKPLLSRLANNVIFLNEDESFKHC